jgi:hypothetical protein
MCTSINLLAALTTFMNRKHMPKKGRTSYVGSQVLTAVAIFRDIMPCSPLTDVSEEHVFFRVEE